MKTTPVLFRMVPGPMRGGGARALAEARRWARPAAVALAWALTAIILGVVLGLASVILPPTGVFGMVGVAGLILLWATPDLASVPTRLLRKAFFVFLAVHLCVPAYYALDIPSLPWISIRRFATGAMILLFAFSAAASSEVRRDLVERMKISPMLAVCVIGFYIIYILSILTALNPIVGLSGLTEMTLEWLAPCVIAVCVVRTYSDVIIAMKILCFASLLTFLAGFVEFRYQHNFLLDIFPPDVLREFLEQNPYYEGMLTPYFRNGMYRAISIFATSNSFGEFAAIVFPIGLFFATYTEKLRERIFGILVVVAAFASVVISGARVGYIGMLVAAPLFSLLWTLRETKRQKGQIGPAFVALLLAVGFAAVVVAVLFWPKAHVFVFGDGMAVYSSEARSEQWASGLPHILANPITGHGNGSSGVLVGWASGDGRISVDSYPLTLLLDFGVPGLLFFSGLVLMPVWYGVRASLAEATQMAALRGAIACSFLAFGFSRIWLSQTENNGLIFSLVGVVIATNAIAASGQVQEEHVLKEGRTRSGARRMERGPVAPAVRKSVAVKGGARTRPTL